MGQAQFRQGVVPRPFAVGLVHPHRSRRRRTARRGEAFLERLELSAIAEVDAAAIERDAQIPDRVVRGLCDLGAFGMKIATAVRRGGPQHRCTTTRHSHSWALCIPRWARCFSAHQSIGVPQPINMFGTEEQKRTWLPRCTQEISAFLLTEPDVGSDPARLHTTATPDGDDYVLNGVKLWTTNGVIADLLVVMAKVPKATGTAVGSPPSWWKRTHRASWWRTATRSWGCAASKMGSPG